MLLTTLHWPDEIRSVGELDLGDEDYDFKPAELKMAQQLVSAMTGEFDPAQYKDEYREALETIIQAKVEGEETVEIEQPEEGGKLVDLMAALEASVNAAKAARAGSEPVSVADAKAAKEAKAASGGAEKAAGGRATRATKAASGSASARKRAADEEEEEAEATAARTPAKTARKRKTA
jgi:DNA end-binding protein Ku